MTNVDMNANDATILAQLQTKFPDMRKYPDHFVMEHYDKWCISEDYDGKDESFDAYLYDCITSSDC